MKSLLAIDTATDALSIALSLPQGLRVSHQNMPRRHQQQLFSSLDHLLDGDALASLELDGIVFGSGPGSFTGLRIAASAAQGLGFSLGLPLVGVSSLETQAHTLLRLRAISGPCLILSCIDARIKQVYAASYFFDGSAVQVLSEAVVSSPESLEPVKVPPHARHVPVFGVGGGYAFKQAMEKSWQHVSECWPEIQPEAQDMLGPACLLIESGDAMSPEKAAPDYVQRGSTWKKLAEQGRKS